MAYELKRVALSEIDQTEDTFRITTNTDTESLSTAIQIAGMINPPVLCQRDDTALKVVSGFRRIAAATLLGWRRLLAAVLAPGTDMIACARIAIVDNMSQRALNLLETSRALCLLENALENPAQLPDEAAALGLPDNAGIIRKIKGLCELPEAVQGGIISSAISLPSALEFAAMPAEATRFAAIFECLRPSLNKQREILTLVQEIAHREDLSVLQVLADPTIEEALNEEDSDRARKLQKIRACLKQRRFPAITRAERAFEASVKKLKLGTGTRLMPPKNFEGSDYTLVVGFKNRNELKKRISAIKKLPDHPDLAKILS